MQDHMVDIKAFFTSLPGNNVLLLPDGPLFTVIAVSDGYLLATGRSRSDMVGKGLFEVFPNDPADPEKISEKTVRASLEYAGSHKEPHRLPVQRYDITGGNGEYEERYWSAVNEPILSETGEVLYLVHAVQDVTAKIKEEQRATQIRSMEKVLSLFMQAPIIVGLLKGEHYVLEMANAEALRLWGKSGDIVGKPLLEAIPELEEQGVLELFDQVRTTGRPYYARERPIVVTLRNGQQKRLYFNLAYQPYYEEGSEKPVGVFTLSHEVTEQVEARQRIQESEEKYRSLFEAIDEGFCLLELLFEGGDTPADFRYLEVNSVFEKQTGLHNPTGKTVRELVPVVEEHWLKSYGNVAATGEPQRFVAESRGMGRWFEVYAFRVGGAGSRRVGVFLTDVTRRKQAEEALRESEERLKKAVSIETVGVIYFDLKGGIHDANEAFQRMSGYSREDFTSGRVDWRQLTPPEFMEVTLKSKEEFETRWQNTPYEKQYIRPDGSRWWGLFAGKRLSEHECVEFVLDITETKHMEEELERKVQERTLDLEKLNTELRRSNTNLEEFAYAASHDLKEPIRKIHFFTDRLLGRLDARLEDEDRRLFERMQQATKRMANLIEDLLLYSHMSKGMVLEDRVDLNVKVKRVLEDLELEIMEKGAHITVEPLPVVIGNKRRLQQLFQNLISNALKYCRPGICPDIRITSRRVRGSETPLLLSGEDATRQFHLIQVKDNGIGFNQDDAERIFNVFTRLHGSEEYKGSGVGLSIARKVVEHHHGHIWAESEPGTGATFNVLLPAQ
ncbi:PAS domain S-box protein [Paraflavisolibacter sp. H34]|uniref:PAS domain S-box protein n=1 Tax=Huijunlia imazamoxiresistens TaxID=3127457 RepID=UPI003019BD5D